MLQLIREQLWIYVLAHSWYGEKWHVHKRHQLCQFLTALVIGVHVCSVGAPINLRLSRDQFQGMVSVATHGQDKQVHWRGPQTALYSICMQHFRTTAWTWAPVGLCPPVAVPPAPPLRPAPHEVAAVCGVHPDLDSPGVVEVIRPSMHGPTHQLCHLLCRWVTFIFIYELGFCFTILYIEHYISHLNVSHYFIWRSNNSRINLGCQLIISTLGWFWNFDSEWENLNVAVIAQTEREHFKMFKLCIYIYIYIL